MRLPPSSPLFPYTTLFRSSASRLGRRLQHDQGRCRGNRESALDRYRKIIGRDAQSRSRHAVRSNHVSRDRSRSEEHTSELQSRRDLVCRLLLEKKKNKQTI